MTKKDVREQRRTMFYNASTPGQYERIKAAIDALPKVPQKILEDLEILKRVIGREDWQQSRVMLRDLRYWYETELRRLKNSSRTIKRKDRILKAEFMRWAAGIDRERASNVKELMRLPGFDESWIKAYKLLTIRAWAREAGFRFKRGAPKGTPQNRIIRS